MKCRQRLILSEKESLVCSQRDLLRIVPGMFAPVTIRDSFLAKTHESIPAELISTGGPFWAGAIVLVSPESLEKPLTGYGRGQNRACTARELLCIRILAVPRLDIRRRRHFASLRPLGEPVGFSP